MDVAVGCSEISDDQTIDVSWLHVRDKDVVTVRLVIQLNLKINFEVPP